jgi:hypothetical protein
MFTAAQALPISIGVAFLVTLNDADSPLCIDLQSIDNVGLLLRNPDNISRHTATDSLLYYNNCIIHQ